MKWMRSHAIYIAWVMALIGLLLSIYFAEVLNLDPCRLCWYQRIAVFPLAFFLGIAAWKHEARLARYCLPFAYFGLMAAVYQMIMKIFPALHSPFLCGATQCSLAGISPWLTVTGFTSIAFFIYFSDAD
jgi:disulfide bond formation protein DsbB